MDIKFISDVVEKNRDVIITFLRRLIDIPTENLPPTGNEFEGQEFFKNACRDIGLEVDEFRPDDIEDFETNEAFLKGRSYINRYNVVGKWRVNGGGRSIVLSGHMDVAPKEPMPWKVCEPFKSRILNGRIYGRGSCDMKGGLAAAYMSVKILKDLGWRPRGDIILESVVDEEYASGNGTIASRLRGHNGDFAINTEPTGLIICPACVGAVLFKITVHGSSGMPYTGEEIYNPVHGIAEIVEILKMYEKDRNRRDGIPELRAEPEQQLNVIITKISGGETKEHGQIGIPMDAWLEVVIQTCPGETEHDVRNKFDKYLQSAINEDDGLKNARVSVERLYHYIEPCATDIGHEGIAVLAGCLERITGSVGEIAYAPFSCDLFAFEKYGKTPAVLFGPLGGNLHAPDEWVDIDSVVKAVKILILMLDEWCGGKEA